jgi:hypothetical protein
MGLTAFSFILLPLCLFWLASPDKLLRLLVIAAVFEAAAALTIGGLGLQPGLVPAVAFLAFVALQLMLGARYPGEAQVLRVTRPFVLVTIWAVASSYLMPRLFMGAVYVWPQKEVPPFVLTALAPTTSNINQDIYLIVNCALLVTAAMFLTKSRLSPMPFIRAYFLSGFVVAGIAFWQFAHKVAGVPYPDTLFYSNPGWAILTEQQIGRVPRINGPFSEPAALAGYMSSVVYATGWLMLKGHRDAIVRWLFAAALTTILLSTSTTGFVCLAIAGIGALIYAFLNGPKQMTMTILRIGIPFILLLGAILIAASLLVPGFNHNVAVVIDATLSKPRSTSFEDRTSTDGDSIAAALGTYGLGAGWGSNRSSSLIPGLLAGIGVPGCAGLIWFGARVVGLARRAHRAGCSREQRFVIDGCGGALAGFLVAAAISAPTLTSVTFFFLLALLIASAARVRLQVPRAVRPVAGPASSVIPAMPGARAARDR